MQVDVTAENIVIYKLVELTGNSAEVMLQRAKEAEDEGYTLTCDVPEDHILTANIFDVFEPKADVETVYVVNEKPLSDDVVKGEVIDNGK